MCVRAELYPLVSSPAVNDLIIFNELLFICFYLKNIFPIRYNVILNNDCVSLSTNLCFILSKWYMYINRYNYNYVHVYTNVLHCNFITLSFPLSFSFSSLPFHLLSLPLTFILSLPPTLSLPLSISLSLSFTVFRCSLF